MRRRGSKRDGRKGNMVLEAAMLMPFLFLLIVGMVQIGKVTYVYYTLKKTLYTAGEFLSTRQGVDFCSDSNGLIAAAKSYALTGTTDASVDSFLPALTADLIDISPECYDPVTQSVGQCDTSGCDSVVGVSRPDFIVVSIPDGYQWQPRIPYILLDPVLLRPFVRVPFGGT